MSSQLVAIGDIDRIRAIVGDRPCKEKEDVVVFSVESSEQARILKELQDAGVEACLLSQIEKIVGDAPKCVQLRPYDKEAVYEWQKTGLEFFGITFSGVLEVCSIDKSEVTVTNKVEPIEKCVMSSTGAIFGFIRGNAAIFYINDEFVKIFDVKASEPPRSIMYSENDRYVCILFKSRVEIYDIIAGELIHSENGTVCELSGQYVYFSHGDFNLDTRVFTKQPKATIVKACAGKVAKFIDGKLQQIIYKNGGTTQQKNHNGIVNVKFYFSESKMFALLTKNVDGKSKYIIESYSGTEITINQLDHAPAAMSVTDDMFVIADVKNKLIFYRRERYGFTAAKTIKKEGAMVISCRGDITCVYDSMSQTIEIYDKMDLRSVYTQHGCSNIVWSESGLYVAVYAKNGAVSSLLQIFTCDGRLVYRKTYNQLTNFQWRNFIRIDEEAKKLMEPFNETNCENEESEDATDVVSLLSEWKSYLLTKKQRLQATTY